jgi:hypothetical protein
MVLNYTDFKKMQSPGRKKITLFGGENKQSDMPALKGYPAYRPSETKKARTNVQAWIAAPGA